MPYRVENHSPYTKQKNGVKPHQKRKSARSRGYTRVWEHLRKLIIADYIEESNSIFCSCGKRPVSDVHHIDGNVDNMDRDNLQPLCHVCHSKLTAKEHGFNKIKKRM